MSGRRPGTLASVLSHRPPSELHGEIRDGVVESYRFVDNVWSFELVSARFKGHVFTGSREGERARPPLFVERIKVIAVDQKLGGAAISGGEAGPSTAPSLPQFDGADGGGGGAAALPTSLPRSPPGGVAGREGTAAREGHEVTRRVPQFDGAEWNCVVGVGVGARPRQVPCHCRRRRLRRR